MSRPRAVDEIDGVVEPDPGTTADTGTTDGDGEMGLAGAGSADHHGIALVGEEATGRQLADQPLVGRRAGKIEPGDILCQRQLGHRQLILDRPRLLLVDLSGEQIADNTPCRMLAFEALDGRHDSEISQGS